MAQGPPPRTSFQDRQHELPDPAKHTSSGCQLQPRAEDSPKVRGEVAASLGIPWELHPAGPSNLASTSSWLRQASGGRSTHCHAAGSAAFSRTLVSTALGEHKLTGTCATPSLSVLGLCNLLVPSRLQDPVGPISAMPTCSSYSTQTGLG